MKTPWFMHTHDRRNTLVGVYPTPVGAFMRSWRDDRVEISWYPMGYEFPGGENRVVESVYTSTSKFDEDAVDQAVADFMHAHPVLCMVRNDDPGMTAIEDWSATAAGDALQVMPARDGAYLRTHAHGFITIEFQRLGIARSIGSSVVAVDFRAKDHEREMICRISDACGDELASLRADRRVRRYMTLHAAEQVAA